MRRAVFAILCAALVSTSLAATIATANASTNRSSTDGVSTSASNPPADVYGFGDAPSHGSTGALPLSNPIVGIAGNAARDGYYLVASDGGIFSFGEARYLGSTGGMKLNKPIVGMAVTPSGNGYWLVASDGGIFGFGDATFYGSTGGIKLNQPIVGMASTPSGHGYWLVASDGGMFSFGDATFFGSTGGMHLNKPIVGMASTPSGHGYWLVASDGGIFSFGDASFHGSTGAIALAQPITGMATSPTGQGYWLVARDGGIFNFGDATFHGSMGGVNLGTATVVGMVASATGAGYWLATSHAFGTPAPPKPPGPPGPPAPPSSRRLTVTFSTSYTSAPDTMFVRYYSHDHNRVDVYTCVNPNEKYRDYAEGFTETWASVTACTSSSGPPRQMRVVFATNYTTDDYFYVRIFYANDVSYQFACKAPRETTAWTPTASSDTRFAGADVCYVDDSTPAYTPQPVPPPLAPGICGSSATPPATYQHIVVIMMENKTWPDVGGTNFSAMPFTQQYAKQCTTYEQWLETNPVQDSLPQYIGLTSGVDNPAVYNDCAPSSTCRSTDNNIFRQVRDAGGTPRTFVEGATTGCSGPEPANVPALYYFGGTDHSFCNAEVRPFPEFDVNALPTFAMLIPTLCDNGHSCPLTDADEWLHLELPRILGGTTYQAGKTAVFVIYDEDRPMPNLIIAPTAHTGQVTTLVASHNDALKTFDEMLGLTVLPTVTSAVSLRATAHL